MSFADHEKAKYWSSKNGDLKPEDVVSGMYNKLYWFKCHECKHKFERTVKSIRDGRWCPYCSTSIRKLCDKENCIVCYNRSFASHKRAAEWSDKNNITSRKTPINSNKIAWFYCDKCQHDYDMKLDDIIKFRCPYCTSHRLCHEKECMPCFNKSFASSKKSKYFSKNNNINPRFLFKNAEKKYKFNCKCGHTFESSLANVSHGYWCPYCCIGVKKLCDDDECLHCYNNSFASNKKSKYWSKINKITPRQITKYSQKYFYFDCPDCFHTFYSILSDFTKGSWCSYCTSQKLCTDKNCKTCFNKSFASLPYSKNWSKKNKQTPRDVFKGCSSRKYWFDCNKCNKSFDAVPLNIKNGSGCPTCKNKTELILYEWLDEYTEYDIKTQAKYEWCRNPKTNKYFRFDFVIEDEKLIIELDGEQHFKQVCSWKSPDYTRKGDVYKMKQAMKNGYSIVRLLQRDVFDDKKYWKKQLLRAIVKNKKPTFVAISGGNEYDLHLKDMEQSSESSEDIDSEDIEISG